LLVSLVLGTANAHAQTEPVSIDEVVRMLREESPSARALEAAARLADAEVDVAGLYPNPTLSYVGMARFDGTANAINGSQHQIWFEIPLLFGTHDARREAAAASAVATRAELEVQLLGLEVRARRAYLDLVVAEERAVRIEAALTELSRVRELVTARASAGAQSEYDGARIAMAMAQAQANLAIARTDAHAAALILAALVGRPGWIPRPSESLAAQDRAYATIEDMPAVVAARRRVEAAERDVHRAEMERIPEMTLGAGAYFTTDGDSTSGYLGLSIPLPVFDTGEAAVRRAEAAQAAATEEHEAVIAYADAALQGAVSLLEARREALASFDEATASRSDEMSGMAEAAYRLGVTGIFELLDAFDARLELALTRIELLSATVAAEIDVLEVATGR
jgi:cobalt-zinc-cadmium efflux system outer membrane protein